MKDNCQVCFRTVPEVRGSKVKEKPRTGCLLSPAIHWSIKIKLFLPRRTAGKRKSFFDSETRGACLNRRPIHSILIQQLPLFVKRFQILMVIEIFPALKVEEIEIRTSAAHNFSFVLKIVRPKLGELRIVLV